MRPSAASLLRKVNLEDPQVADGSAGMFTARSTGSQSKTSVGKCAGTRLRNSRRQREVSLGNAPPVFAIVAPSDRLSTCCRSSVGLSEVVGSTSTLRGRELLWRMHRCFPRCLETLEAMGRQKGLILLPEKGASPSALRITFLPPMPSTHVATDDFLFPLSQQAPVIVESTGSG